MGFDHFLSSARRLRLLTRDRRDRWHMMEHC
jgi:hypothetical protein